MIDGLEHLDRDEVAALLNVKPSTVSAWVSRAKMPQPTRYVARSPLWLVSDIERWKASRPGKGRPRQQ